MWDSVVTGIQNAMMQFRVDPYWEATAFIGETIFGGRFVLQWIVSEYKKKSYVPTAFWYLSIIGCLVLLAYFIHIEKPVLILACTLQLLIYVRNICLIKKHRQSKTGQTSTPAQET